MKKEIVDIRYVAKCLFLMTASFNLGHTFEATWLGLLFAIYFAVTGFLNATSRKEFSKRPKYNKIPAYGAIVPLALYWVVTPGVENGVNPMMIFLPGLYLLFLAALQERSRGNGGFEAFVAFDGVAALLFGMFMVPKGWAVAGIVGLLLCLFAYSRRGTAWYKYLLFVLLVVALGGIAFGGWRYWRAHRYEKGARWAEDYYQRERVMGFDQVAALGSFGSNYNGKYNGQVVLRVWDSLPSNYLKAASYEKYVAGIWKLPTEQVKTLTPAYYQVDYAVMEVMDSVTSMGETPAGSANHGVRQVWVQSSVKNFGFVFAPYGAVGYAAKDVDSLQYFAGGMVRGLDQNGKRSDWYYFVCDAQENGDAQGVGGSQRNCVIPDSLLAYSEGDLHVGARYEALMDSVVAEMGLVRSDSISGENSDAENLQRVLAYFKNHFTYSLQIPGLERWRSGGNVTRDPLSVFWHAKQGFCEYYATLAALALRRVGIPARYATGFAHPEVVEGRPYAVFRRKHAHSWVEVFVDGHWAIFDPTPPMFSPLGTEPSWFSVKWEGIRGRAARIMHFLKEGEWRRSVDSWQNYTQSFIDSGIPYLLLVLLSAFLVAIKTRGALRARQKRIVSTSAKAILWTKKLDAAEKELARAGFHREPGETVGDFLRRVEGHEPADAVEILREYERNRWCS